MQNIASHMSLMDALSLHAIERPHAHAYTFLEDGVAETESVTFGTLNEQVHSIARDLMKIAEPGTRALLLYPSGLDFVRAFLACLYAGVVAVPIHIPRSRHHLDRLAGIVHDAQAELLLTTYGFFTQLHDLFGKEAASVSGRWIFTDQVSGGAGSATAAPRWDKEGLAFLQYTSGSTSSPKGVMISHRNISFNQELIQEGFCTHADSVVVSWLPHYHDMGLIGGILQPLWVGAKCILISPNAFLRHPSSWLNTISRYRGTTSGGPNFAYELCIEKISDVQKRDMDLSSWVVAFNGAEAIRPRTIKRFTEAFKAVGFSQSAVTPCYGLAEATLLVSSKHSGQPYSLFDSHTKESYQSEDLVEPISTNKAIVSCGSIGKGLRVLIVDPETREELPNKQIGEIVIEGPSVAQGYWKNAAATAETFDSRLNGRSERFLRTGDLGFFSNGELAITGRLKDLIIINGRNYHAEDIEFTVANVHPALATCPGAAFGIDRGVETAAVLVQEIPRRTDEVGPLGELARQIHSLVAEEREIVLESVVLVRAASIPRTTSGKVKRQSCRDLYLAGDLEVRFEHRAGQATELNAAIASISIDDTEDELILNLQSVAARILQRSPDAIDPDSTLLALGFDSLRIVNLQTELEATLGVQIPFEAMLGTVTPRELVTRLKQQILPKTVSKIRMPELPGIYPLSVGQHALFFIQLVSPGNPSYNLFSASRTFHRIDLGRLSSALSDIVCRHPILRSVFVNTSSGPMRKVLDKDHVQDLQYIDASGWDDQKLHEYLQSEANRPFDLTLAPPLRVKVLHQATRGDVLLFVTHHIITDLWSVALFFEELAELYSTDADSSKLSLSRPAPAPYSSFVERQAELSPSREQQQKKYWMEYLRGSTPLLDLPFDHSSEYVTQKGRSLWFELDNDLSAQLIAMAKIEEVSVYTLLLAAYAVLLLRITGQDDVLIGSPVAGRHSATDVSTIGYFVNEVVLRARWNPDLSFQSFLHLINADVSEALANQDYPFSSLVENLGHRRDARRLPLTQTLFGFHNTEHMHGLELGSFALGRAGARFTKGDLDLHAIPIENEGAQSELTLFMIEENHQFHGLFQYDSERFEERSIHRIFDQFTTLLRAIAQDSRCRLIDTPILNPVEQQRLLEEWNQTQSEYDDETSVSDLIRHQAELLPKQRAVTAHDGTMTYGELTKRMASIASALRSRGVHNDSVVALHCSRSTHLLAGMLGILDSGGAFLPIDPALPLERIAYMVTTTGVRIGVTDSAESEAKLLATGISEIIRLELSSEGSVPCGSEPLENDFAGNSSRLAYVIFTSGSTGKPKGVMVTHRNLLNFFHAMTKTLDCDVGDRFYALTSTSFDISMLELLWPLTQGAEVALVPERNARSASLLSIDRQPMKGAAFSLFYFADASNQRGPERYRLLLEGAKFADQNGFAAVWTPERHFHRFGGSYPSPSVTSAAIASVTERIAIRAGSVVLPLHDPIRVAEEWSMIDNLSGGRVGVAFASGWHVDDFVLAPDRYSDRREIMLAGIERLQQLWRGESVDALNGSGKKIQIQLHPSPVQANLPIWITASGTPATFEVAGRIGANLLTHLLGQTLEEVASNIKRYHEALKQNGFDPATRSVTLMLHTYLGESRDSVKDRIRIPFREYLRTSLGLVEKLIISLGLPIDLKSLSPKDLDDLLDFAFNRYWDTSGLFGTVDSCRAMVDQIIRIGVTEIACLIDFGVDTNMVLESLPLLRELMHVSRSEAQSSIRTSAETDRRRRTFLQCTPSMMKLLLAEGDDALLGTIDTLLLGGEPLPGLLVDKIQERYNCRIFNMYGPTETTIWSTIEEVESGKMPISVGKPIANTRCYIVDRRGLPVPIGSIGELLIGGDGVARGYWCRNDLTNERFIRDSFTSRETAYLYRTGDLARYLPDGRIEILGRTDHQVKIRGGRVELSEIELSLNAYEGILDTVVLIRGVGDDLRLTAFYVSSQGHPIASDMLRGFLRKSLPEYMIPSDFVHLEKIPLMTSGKVDRRQLETIQMRPHPVTTNGNNDATISLGHLESQILEIWKKVLHLDTVGMNDNFFDLGGHSLLMIQVHNSMTERLGYQFPLIRLLENPTIRQLANSIAADKAVLSNGNSSRESGRIALQRQRLEQMRNNALATRSATP
jgi:natural product biosynthesis luciferase-like monooxygenase protein